MFQNGDRNNEIEGILLYRIILQRHKYAGYVLFQTIFSAVFLQFVYRHIQNIHRLCPAFIPEVTDKGNAASSYSASQIKDIDFCVVIKIRI